jgi:phosphatidylserine decarboxylase
VQVLAAATARKAVHRGAALALNGKNGMVKEGYWYGLPLVLLAGGLVGIGLYALGVFFLIVALLTLNFFRDPERRIPADPNAVVSPADGRVVAVQEEPVEGRLSRRVSIFMSPLDVHVNRSPITGVIQDVAYHRGRFRVAFEPLASVENEQNVLTIQGQQGTVVVKQIAGLIARRIVFWKKSGDRLERGERFGLIKFGSRVDVVVEPEVELRVKVGDHVKAGSTILGDTKGIAPPASA